MLNKPLHIVFQVLNFLSSFDSDQFLLTSDEKILLIFLSKHKGDKGIYPSVRTLGRELKRSDSAIRRTLNKLSEKNIIKINHIPGKSSHYFLPFLEKLSTAPSVHASTISDTPLASTLVHPSRPRLDTPSADARQSIQKNNLLNNTERAHKRAPLISVDESFEPDQERKAKCAQLGHDLNFITQKFVAVSKAYGKKYKDLQCAFELFVLNEKVQNKPKLTVVASTTGVCNEPKYVEYEKNEICEGCKRPMIYCRCKHKLEKTSSTIQEIIKKIKL